MPAAYAKPTKYPLWNTGGANRSEPSGGKKILGWEVDEVPPSSWENWLKYTSLTWLQWMGERFIDGADENEFAILHPENGGERFHTYTAKTVLEGEVWLDDTGGDLRTYESGGYIGFLFEAGATSLLHDTATDELIVSDAADALMGWKTADSRAYNAFICEDTFEAQDTSHLKGVVTIGTDAVFKAYESLGASDYSMFDMDANDIFYYKRDDNKYYWTIGSVVEATLDASGMEIGSGLKVGAIGAGTMYDGDINIIGGGIAAGVTPATNPTPGDAIFTRGLVVGYDGAPSADAIGIGDANHVLSLAGGDPTWQAASGDSLSYNRTSNLWIWEIGSDDLMELSATALYPDEDAELDLGISGTNPWNTIYGVDLNIEENVFIGDVITLGSSSSLVEWMTTAGDAYERPVTVQAKNMNAGTLSQYEIVALVTNATDEIRVDTTNVQGSMFGFGVVYDSTITTGSFGRIAIFGSWKVKCATVESAGEHIGTSTTAGTGVAISAAGEYAIGQLLQNSNGTDPVRIWLTGSHSAE